MLLVTGLAQPQRFKTMRKFVAKLVADGPYVLTESLFAYRTGRFTKFGR
jgi:hypothetical protein